MAYKNYFDITKVEGVTAEIITEYKKLVRRERYLTETDKAHIIYQYGTTEELYSSGLFSHTPEYNDDSSQIKLLYKSLRMLRRLNGRDYNIIMDYFFSCEKTSYSILAKKYGVSKQTIHNSIRRSLLFLRKAILLLKKDGEIE